MAATQTVRRMAHHITHVGVHDHGFNNVSTYGNLWRLMGEGRIPENERERNFYELALKCSGAVQASRWTLYRRTAKAIIYSFNGPHSLFADTIRSLRALALSHQLGHVLMGEKDVKISLLRAADRARADHGAVSRSITAKDATSTTCADASAHESIFNVNDGNYRCPNSQQGYSPFTTWTRGLAWIMCGYAGAAGIPRHARGRGTGAVRRPRSASRPSCSRAARATCDFYIEHTPDGRHPVLGHRRAGTCTSSATISTARRTRSTITSRWTAPPRRSPRRVCLRLGHYLEQARRARRGAALLAGRAHRAEQPCSTSRISAPTPTTRACCCTPSITGRTAGTISRRTQGAVRRVEHVGRLPCAAKSRSTCSASSKTNPTSPSSAASNNPMIISDLAKIDGRRYPARRLTQNLVGGVAPDPGDEFRDGQRDSRPERRTGAWHNQEQEEVYFIVEGTGEMCLGEERQTVTAGQAVYIPSGVFHQLTNIGDTPLRMIYCYGPAATWPTGGRNSTARCPRPASTRRRCPQARSPQCTDKPAEPVTSCFRQPPSSNSTTHYEPDTQHSQSRHHHERRHRTHGHQPALHPLDPRHHQTGRRARSATTKSSCPIRSSSAATRRSSGSSPRMGDGHPLHHRPRQRAGRSAQHDLLRRADHRPPRRCGEEGHRRGQARLLRKADGRLHRSRLRTLRGRQKSRRQKRRRAGQALAARPGEAQDSSSTPGFFGEILSVRGEFGYWVFAGGRHHAAAPVAGTTARKTTAASSSTCSATGATCSTIFSAK